MTSQWFSKKNKALTLRKSGRSIRHIEKTLGIPRSTLSNWFREIKLTRKQKIRLLKNWKAGLERARKKAVLWHNDQKRQRLLLAKKEAAITFKQIKLTEPVLDLALAMLYIAEGMKKSSETAMGNSDPVILRVFINILRNNYKLDPAKIRCELHLRADQNIKKTKRYWSREIGVPLKNFTSVSVDLRTKGSKTYSSYKGVCVVRCSSVAIQRKLMYLAKLFSETVINRGRLAQG